MRRVLWTVWLCLALLGFFPAQGAIGSPSAESPSCVCERVCDAACCVQEQDPEAPSSPVAPPDNTRTPPVRGVATLPVDRLRCIEPWVMTPRETGVFPRCSLGILESSTPVLRQAWLSSFLI